MWILPALYGCGFPCSELRTHGISGSECPDSELRLSVAVTARDLTRAPIEPLGTVTVTPSLSWLVGDGVDATVRSAPLTGEVKIGASLVDPEGRAVPLPLGPFLVDGAKRTATVGIPRVPDGDYQLRIDVDAGVDRASAAVPVGFYAPAVVHVLTDRPLYRPGEEVRLRSLVLRSDDLHPIADRPGHWRVFAPDGVELLTEPTTAGPWGVADSSLPLHPEAPPGQYRATYRSGDDEDEARFEVRRFALPKVAVDVVADRPWYGSGDELVIRGVARYTSGGPVAHAPIDLVLSAVSGIWPAPAAWGIPRIVETRQDGTFRATWTVPGDLLGRSVFSAEATVRPTAGEAVRAETPVVLSESRLWLETITELDDGLVGGVNNRAYLRVATPDGTALSGARIQVSNPWDPGTRPKVGEADEDGVIAFQIDPGDPVTLVEPVPPTRAPPAPPTERVTASATELTEDREPTLDEAVALDRAADLVEPCRGLEGDEVQRPVGLQVAASGSVIGVVAVTADPTSACIARRLQVLRMPAGDERTFQATFFLPDSDRPLLRWEPGSTVGVVRGSAVADAVDGAALAARGCLAPGEGQDGAPIVAAHWRTTVGSTGLDLRIAELDGHGASADAVGCLATALRQAKLPAAAETDALGVLIASLDVPSTEGTRPAAPQPTTVTGYELKVIARDGDRLLGEGRIRFPVGEIPDLRLRATPSVAGPGDTVTVEILRGPGLEQALPDELTLRQGDLVLARAPVEEDAATFTVPDDARGFLTVAHGGVEALVLVDRPDRLDVVLSGFPEEVRPGETARLTVATTAGGEPTQAAVGLIGVDAALARLAPLPGPDEYGRVTVRARSRALPFGTLDAAALVLGRIRGANAAQAAMLGLVLPPGGDRLEPRVSGAASTDPDLDAELERGFARVFEIALRRVREWEAGAVDGQSLDNAAMAAIWEASLAELRPDSPATDGWGRELTLAHLPPAQLEQLDPRRLVQDGTHLPEDMVAWPLYVSRSQ